MIKSVFLFFSGVYLTNKPVSTQSARSHYFRNFVSYSPNSFEKRSKLTTARLGFEPHVGRGFDLVFCGKLYKKYNDFVSGIVLKNGVASNSQ